MVYMMKFNRNLAIFTILLAVICLILVSQVSATDFNGTELSDLDNTIKTSDDGIIVLTDDLTPAKSGTIVVDKPVTIDGSGHEIKLADSQIDKFLDVQSDLTLKNLLISGGELKDTQEIHSYVLVNENSRLTLENVTVHDVNIGNTLNGAVFYNFGTISVQNSLFENIGGYASPLFNNAENAISVTFENSTYQNSAVSYGAYFGTYNIKNSVFSNISCQNAFFEHIEAILNIESSLFINIDGTTNGLTELGVHPLGSILNNVFLGTSNGIIKYDELSQFVIENNYFGTNDPIGDGLITGDTSNFNIDDNIKLDISLPDNDDINNLTVGKEIPIVFKLIGDTQSLPVFNVSLVNKGIKSEFSQDSVTFDKDNPITVYFTPREKGTGSIILGDDLNIAIKPSLDYTADGELKNYTLEISSKDSITYGDDLVVSFELKDADSNPVSGSLSLYVNGNYYDNVTVSEGTGSITLSKLNAPSADLTAFFKHNLANHNDKNANKSISISKKDLELVFDDLTINEGETATFVVSNVPDDTTDDFTVSIGSNGGQVRPSNGIISQTFSGLDVGTHAVSIYYCGDNNYEGFDEIAYIYVVESNGVNPGDNSGSDDNSGDGTGNGDDSGSDAGSGSNTPSDVDTPDSPETPGDGTGNGDDPVTPESPESPDVPDSSDSSGDDVVPGDEPSNPQPTVNPESPESPDVPDSSDSSGDDVVPGDEPANSEPSSNPDVPNDGNADVPDSPDIPDEGNVDVPDSQNVPQDTPYQGDTEVPDSQNVPQDLPDEGDVDVPDQSDADSPDIPVTPNSGNSDVPTSDDRHKNQEQKSDSNPSDNGESSDAPSSNSQSNQNSDDGNDNVNSDNIVSRNVAQDVDTTIGTSTNAVNSNENSNPSEGKTNDANPSQGASGDSLDVLKAYDISEVIDEVIHNEVTYEAFGLAIIFLILLIVGYRRKDKEDE